MWPSICLSSVKSRVPFVTPQLNLEALARLPAAVRRPDYDFLNLGAGARRLPFDSSYRSQQSNK